jgi:hypothetical protein
MKRLMSGTVLLGAVLAATACNDVTDSLSGDATRIIATPTFLIGDTAATKNVLVQTFDDQGMPVVGAATVSGVTGTITAIVDSTYRPGGLPVVTQILVRGTALGTGTFTTTANGLSTDVNVTVAPPAENYVGTASDYAPLMGATITLTTPAGEPYRFTPASRAFIGPVTVAKSLMTLTGISADSLTATFVVDSVRRGLAVIDAAVLNYNTAVGASYRVASTDTVRVIPLTPATLTAAPNGTAGIDLDWSTDPGGASPYAILRSGTTGGPYAIVDSVRASAGPPFTDVNVTSGTTYFYVVQACNTNTDVCSGNSPEASATAP